MCYNNLVIKPIIIIVFNLFKYMILIYSNITVRVLINSTLICADVKYSQVILNRGTYICGKIKLIARTA